MSELRTEARLLLQTVEDRLLELRSLVSTPDPAAAGRETASDAGAVHDHPEHSVGSGGVGAVNGCPLCTLLAVLRGERPDLASALIDGAMTVLALARSLVSEQPAPDGAVADRPADGPPAGDLPTGGPPTTDPPVGPIPAPAAPQRRPLERIRIS